MKRMMKTALAASAATALLCLSAPAGAAAPEGCQQRDGDKCRFYQFDSSAFEGLRRVPLLTILEGSSRPDFEGLLQIRAPSFLRTLLDTSRMTVFR